MMRAQLIDFKPVWFISIMGTGISTAILFNFPYEAMWLKILSMVMFAVCSFCLGISTILFIFKLILDKKRLDILYNTNFNVFLGCYAMGFTSWVTGLHFLTEEKYSIAVYALWWIGIVMSLFTGWFVFFTILRSSKMKQQDMTSTILLPIVALTVSSSQGGIITPSLPQHLQLSTLIVMFLLWANAMALSFIVTTIYVNRLLFNKLPKKMSIFTSFIPIGFLGQGAFGIQLFGLNYHNYLLSLNQDNQIEATIFKSLGLITGLFLQSLGFFFTFLAIASVLSFKIQKFHHGFWAMTFPLGTMSLAATETYKIIDWTAFRVIGAIYGVSLLIITVSCLIGSLILIIRSEPQKKETPKEAISIETV